MRIRERERLQERGGREDNHVEGEEFKKLELWTYWFVSRS